MPTARRNRPRSPDPSGRRRYDPQGVWHAANGAFNARQRARFNRWRGQMSLAWFALADALELVKVGPGNDDPRHAAAYRRLQSLKDVLSEAPDKMTL